MASLEPAFAELSDSMADLEANFMHLQLLNESLGRFNENFGAFLYGMNMSAFCVDFPEVCILCATLQNSTVADMMYPVGTYTPILRPAQRCAIPAPGLTIPRTDGR